MDDLKVAAGSQILIGAPANPIHPDAVRAIADAVRALTGVQEAHLPQCYIPGVSESPAQVLVLVLLPGVRSEPLMDSLSPQLQGIVPRGVRLDVWPLPIEHELLPAIRGAGCQITGDVAIGPVSSERKWWQFWR